MENDVSRTTNNSHDCGAGAQVHMLLERMDTSNFTLINRGFHWVRPDPYIR